MQARKLSPAFLAAMILFVAPATVALTTYPPYYEDESWIYLAPFEALRGNGFSWAAFHEGTSSAGLFNALAFLFVRISPFAAEATVRLTSVCSSRWPRLPEYSPQREKSPVRTPRSRQRC